MFNFDLSELTDISGVPRDLKRFKCSWISKIAKEEDFYVVNVILFCCVGGYLSKSNSRGSSEVIPNDASSKHCLGFPLQNL